MLLRSLFRKPFEALESRRLLAGDLVDPNLRLNPTELDAAAEVAPVSADSQGTSADVVSTDLVASEEAGPLSEDWLELLSRDLISAIQETAVDQAGVSSDALFGSQFLSHQFGPLQVSSWLSILYRDFIETVAQQVTQQQGQTPPVELATESSADVTTQLLPLPEETFDAVTVDATGADDNLAGIAAEEITLPPPESQATTSDEPRVPDSAASTSDTTAPPDIPVSAATIIDLDGDDSSGVVGNGFQNQFTEEDGYVRLLDTDFTIDDEGNPNIAEVVIQPTGGVPDGNQEFVIFRRSGGVSSVRLNGSETAAFTHDLTDGFDIEYQFDPALGGVVFRALGGGTMPTSTVQLLMEGLRYYNTDDDPDVSTDRVFDIFVRDPGAVASTVARTTISLVAVNDAPELDLDDDNSSNAEPVIVGRDSSDLTFVDSTLVTGSLFNGDTISVAAPTIFSSGLTATDPTFVATYFERAEAIRLEDDTSARVTFSGGAAPVGTLLFFHDVDRSESVEIQSSSGTPVFIEQAETTSGEITLMPTWDPGAGTLVGATENGVGGATIFNISGFSDLTLNVGTPGTLEFGFITPGLLPINYETTFTEGGSPIGITDSDVNASDVDDINVEEVTITLTNGMVGDQLLLDLETFTALGLSVSGPHSTPLDAAGPISLTVTGSVSQANIEAALKRIEFENVSPTPNTTDRLVQFTLSDAQDQSLTAETLIHVIPVDPDVAITKTDGDVTTEFGATTSYTLTVTNVGTIDVTGVVVTDTLPTGTEFNATASTTGWTDLGNGDFQFQLGALAAGASTNLTFSVDLTDNSLTEITNTVSVTDDGGRGPDGNLANNTASDDTPILRRTSSISGVVFADTDDDGIVDTNETPISGVEVTLNGTATTGEVVQRTLTTDDNGAYRFDQLLPGTYTVTEVQPTRFDDGQETTSAVNSTVIANDSLQIVLGQGDAQTVDFGEIASPNLAITKTDNGVSTQVGGIILFNLQVQNVGDKDATGVVVNETVPTGTTFVANSSTTGWIDNGNGNLEFQVGDLGAGATTNLIFAVQLTDDTQVSVDNTATVNDDGALGDDVDPSDNTSSDDTPVINNNARIEGIVFEDLNDDGIFDVGEAPIQSVVVDLNGTTTLGDTVQRTATTDANGNYEFTDLFPGTYTVTETQPNSFNDGQESTSATNSTVIANDSIQIVLAESETLSVDFGEISLGLDIAIRKTDNGATTRFGEITTYILSVENIGNVDASGVVVTENVPSGTAFSASDSDAGWTDNGGGVFQFDVGALSVGETRSIEFALELTDETSTQILNTVTVADDGSSGDDVDPTNNSATDTTPATTNTASITGNVFVDADNDGNLDSGEAPIDGVTIELVGTSANGDPIQRSTTTDATGAYSFDALPPGTYTVNETQPSQFGDGQDNTTALNSTVSNDSIQLELADGETEAVTFGERSIASGNLTKRRFLASG